MKASERSAVPTDALLVAAEERGDELNYVIPLFFRDLPYDYQTLVENVIDPAHVPFSHHKVQGDRDKVKYGDYELKGISDPGKITVENKMMGTHARISFIPPHIVNYSSEAPDVGSVLESLLFDALSSLLELLMMTSLFPFVFTSLSHNSSSHDPSSCRIHFLFEYFAFPHSQVSLGS